MGSLMDNYKIKNASADACQKDWCIAPILGKMQQVTVKFHNGKSNTYVCRYAVSDGAVAIVGRQYPDDSYCVEISTNTGMMGNVTAVFPELTIDETNADEIDYVFNKDPQEEDLQECEAFLQSGSEAYSKTLLATAPVRPISYHILNILTAASVLAHREMVDFVSLELAKSAILEEKSIEKEMLNAAPTPFDPSVSISEIHIPDASVEDVFLEIGEQLDAEDESWYDDEGTLEEMSEVTEEFISLGIVNNYVNKYAHLGAISIMVRGGFKNLLAAYLSVEPAIKEFLPDALAILDGIGCHDTYALLQEYK